MKKRSLNKILFGFFLFFIVFSCLKSVQIYEKAKSFHNLETALNQSCVAINADCSVFIKDLGFLKLSVELKPSEKFPAASLLKLPILAAAFRAIGEGKISLKDKIIIERKDIVGGSGKLKAVKLPYKVTVEKILELMISISDNTAANKIIELLGFEYITKSFRELGLKNTTLVRKMMDFSLRAKGVENYTSSQDIVFILEQIYKKRLVSKKLSRLALSFLKKQKVNDRIPRYLPKELIIAHKTGLERGVVHDAGIVFTSHGDYIICVLVKNTKSYKQAKKFIAQTSLLTYNLYNNSGR